MQPLACYLLRDDGEWYSLGAGVHNWRSSFGAFEGESDGSTMLGPEDVHVLALRLDGYGHDMPTRERMAADIIRWANEGKNPRATWIDDARGKFKFVTELDPEVEPGVQPYPITGQV